MNRPHVIERKRYITFPAAQPRPNVARRLGRHFFGLVAMPFMVVAAWLAGTPGIPIRVRCIGLGLRALAKGDVAQASLLVANPMDSFRYFELDFVSRRTRHLDVRRYLDVSSPRLVTVVVLGDHPGLVADMLNPIASDLQETALLVHTLSLSKRTRMSQIFIEDAAYSEGSFDLITSISVVEHIPDDTAAVAKMWSLLRPGGRLLITMPCARVAVEEFANLDEYELLAKDGGGFVYWQRYYDASALAERIWSVTGAPVRQQIYGEIAPGIYDENVVQKRTSGKYPYWREPLMMARAYRPFDSLEALPGMGVIPMEFLKQPADQA